MNPSPAFHRFLLAFLPFFAGHLHAAESTATSAVSTTDARPHPGIPGAHLTVTASASPAACTLGDPIAISITVANNSDVDGFFVPPVISRDHYFTRLKVKSPGQTGFREINTPYIYEGIIACGMGLSRVPSQRLKPGEKSESILVFSLEAITLADYRFLFVPGVSGVQVGVATGQGTSDGYSWYCVPGHMTEVSSDPVQVTVNADPGLIASAKKFEALRGTELIYAPTELQWTGPDWHHLPEVMDFLAQPGNERWRARAQLLINYRDFLRAGLAHNDPARVVLLQANRSIAADATDPMHFIATTVCAAEEAAMKPAQKP